MRKILLIGVLVFVSMVSTLDAAKIISKKYDGNGYTSTVECTNGKWISITKNNNIYQGLHKISLHLNEVISFECGSNKKISSNEKYGYVKKGALLFKKRKGDGSIEWALSPAPKGKMAHMNKVTLHSILGGNYSLPKNNVANIKVKLLKKFTHNNRIVYILDKDIEIK